MTESNDTPQRTTLVAVDIAKNYHDILIELPTRGRRRRLRLANNLEDFEQLSGYLRSLKSSVLIGFEATGNVAMPAGSAPPYVPSSPPSCPPRSRPEDNACRF